MQGLSYDRCATVNKGAAPGNRTNVRLCKGKMSSPVRTCQLASINEYFCVPLCASIELPMQTKYFKQKIYFYAFTTFTFINFNVIGSETRKRIFSHLFMSPLLHTVCTFFKYELLFQRRGRLHLQKNLGLTFFVVVTFKASTLKLYSLPSSNHRLTVDVTVENILKDMPIITSYIKIG